MDSIPQKQCKKCGESFPETSKYFVTYKCKDKTCLRGECRICHKKYSNNWYHNRMEADPDFAKLRQEYDRNAKSDPVKRERKRLVARERYKVRYTTDENFKSKVHAKNNKRHEIKKSDIEYILKRRAMGRSRRALVYAAEGRFTREDVALQYKSQKGKCWHCGKFVGVKFHVDHLYPLSRGGSNKANNLVISCPECNLSKKDKTVMEWAGRLC